ncbi:MAG: hypothetical protein PHC70_05435 [Patescibacteria group bacterium]|jgi:hypothetical protein|nr:hypothetical protein [Patescibacteria group bacterium]
MFEASTAKLENENPFQMSPYEVAAVRIEPSKFEAMPELDRAQFNVFGSIADDIYDSYKAIMHWLKLPYVHDNFEEDHLARRKWFETLSKEQNLEMLENKFRNNPAGVLAAHINYLKTLLKKSHFLPTNLSLFTDNKPNFKKLHQTHVAEERRAVMENFESQCLAIISYLESCLESKKLAA